MNIYKSIEDIFSLRDEVDSQLERNSIELPSACRFIFYRELFEKQVCSQMEDIIRICKERNLNLDYIPYIYKEYCDFLYALNKILKLYEVITNTTEKRSILKKIKLTFKGTSFIEEENDRAAFSEPRDTLFELNVASQFYDLGLTDIKFLDHPDVLVTDKYIKFGFECKRVRFYVNDNFRNRIESAVNQIRDYKQFHDIGLVCIDVSYLATGGGKMNLDFTFEEFQARTYALMHDLCYDVEQRSSIIRNAITSSNVFGIILFASGLVQLTSGYKMYAFNYVKTFELVNQTAGELFYNSFKDEVIKNNSFDI